MAAQDPDQRSRNLVASTNRTLPVSGLPQDPQDILEIVSVVLSKALEAVLFELSDLRGAWYEGTGSSGLTADSKKLLSLANRMAMRGAGRSGDLTRIVVSHLSAVAQEIAEVRSEILTYPALVDADFSGTKGFLTKTGAGAYGTQLRETSITMLALATEEAF